MELKQIRITSAMLVERAVRLGLLLTFGLFSCIPGAAHQNAGLPQQAPAKSSPASAQPKVTSSQTVVVTESPQDKEDAQIHAKYDEISPLESSDCETAIRRYQSEIIPLAEKSEFKETRAKFFFLAYRGIGGCYLSEKRYADAEAAEKKLLDYVDIWPGRNDPGYPLIYQKIGFARMGVQDWRGAEEQLRQAVALLDGIQEREVKADPEAAAGPFHAEFGLVQANSLNALAIDLYRQGKAKDGLPLLERAYKLSLESGVSPGQAASIVNSGLALSLAAGDTSAMQRWTERSKNQK